ncbi:MAG: alkaline phosphatase [Elusimicrobia bacterium]|nr:alkaline phosphatase [Elusimicrobiota bacterium]
MLALPLLALLALPARAAAVYPPDRAEILVGQAFDFKVEFSTPLGGLPRVTVCGLPLGPEARFIPAEPAVLVRGMRLSVPGPCVVSVDGTPEASWQAYAPGPRKARSVILLIGDGLSLAHRVAARALGAGYAAGRARAPLAMDDMPRTALVGTSASDSLLPDSAQTASAYSMGQKTAVEAVGVLADRTPDPTDDPRVEGLLSLARRKGLSRGLVTTSALYDATPAAFYAHNRLRYEKAAIAAELPQAALEAALGGGAELLRPHAGKLEAAGWAVVSSAAALSSAGSGPLLGLFADGDMAGVYERTAGRAPGQPGLVEMQDAALRVLARDPDGFFLMVEGALIDKFSHDLDWERSVLETIEFDKAVARAKEFAARDGQTLVLVVSDHAQGMSVSGVVRDALPGPDMRDKVGTYDWAGYPDYRDADGDGYPDRLDVPRRLAFFFSAFPDHYETWRPKLDAPFRPTLKADKGVYKANPAYKGLDGAVHREGNIPRALDGGVLSAEDGVLTAMGPGSESVHGWMENTAVFRLIAEALSLGSDPR